MGADVFLVIVNYNTHHHTIECIESVFESKYDNFSIIVVDNSENDDSVTTLSSWIESKRVRNCVVSGGNLERSEFQRGEVLIVRERENRGFAAANNVAVNYLRKHHIYYKYLWFLNNDTVVEPDSLGELVKYLDFADEDVGMVGSKLLFYDRRTVIQAIGGNYSFWLGRVKEVGLGETDFGQYDVTNKSFDYVIGASMFVRKAFIERVGLMNEEYFLYFEELDWALRGKELGFRIAFCSKSKVFHKGGASINAEGGRSLISDFYFFRNRIIITKKYFSFSLVVLYPILGLSIINRVMMGEFSRAKLLMATICNSKKKLSV